MEQALISVIVPIYNVQKYLPKCIESIINQTYINLEIILINDGSLDDCLVICESYEKKDSRIKVINKKNGGLSDARNAGLKVSSGEYVIFVDSDDFIEKNLIHDAYHKLKNDDADVCYFNYSTVDDKGNYLKKDILNLLQEQYEINQNNVNDYLVSKIYTYKHGVEAWNKIYKMSIIKKYSLKYVYNDEIFAEDLLFNLCYLAHVEKITTLDKSYYNYLIRSDSIMSKPKKDLFRRYLNLFDRVEKHWSMYNPVMNEYLPLGYFIWLVSTIKIKIKENVPMKEINDEFKQVSTTNQFKIMRNKLLKSSILLRYIKLCPDKVKHAILIYLMAILCLLKCEIIVIKIINKLFVQGAFLDER